MRCSLCSIREVSVVTLSLTAPTSVRTNFFVAHAVEPAAAIITTGIATRNFFIITTSFVREPGITVTKQEAETAAALENANILIAIRANGEIWMDRRQVDIREVRPLVERLHIERPDDMVVVVADKGSKTGILGKVMDEVKAGGIKDVAIGAAGPAGG